MANSSTYSWTLDFPTPPATLLPPPVPRLPTTLEQDFGADFALLEDGDLDPTFRLESGERPFKLALARRLLTPRGTLDFHPDYGLDLRQFLNAPLERSQLEQLRVAVENELEKEERVSSAECFIRYVVAKNELELQCEVETQRGPFSLTLLVSTSFIQVQ